jgi:hypothetical protein
MKGEESSVVFHACDFEIVQCDVVIFLSLRSLLTPFSSNSFVNYTKARKYKHLSAILKE